MFDIVKRAQTIAFKDVKTSEDDCLINQSVSQIRESSMSLSCLEDNKNDEAEIKS